MTEDYKEKKMKELSPLIANLGVATHPTEILAADQTLWNAIAATIDELMGEKEELRDTIKTAVDSCLLPYCVDCAGLPQWCAVCRRINEFRANVAEAIHTASPPENTSPEPQWRCGKCDEEEAHAAHPDSEPIPEHFRTCPKRTTP